MSINSNIFFKILWTHFVRVVLMLKQIHIFFFTAPCLLIKDAPSWAQLMNDIDSSLTNTNDSILTHILLFGKVSLDISTNTLILTATMKYIIWTNRFQKSLSLVFCNFLLYFHQLFSVSLWFFLRLYIHIHLVLRFAFIYLLTLFFYILFLVIPRWFSNI